jgi:hypothetical protein
MTFEGQDNLPGTAQEWADNIGCIPSEKLVNMPSSSSVNQRSVSGRSIHDEFMQYSAQMTEKIQSEMMERDGFTFVPRRSGYYDDDDCDEERDNRRTRGENLVYRSILLSILLVVGVSVAICSFMALGFSVNPNATDYDIYDRIDDLQKLVISNIVDPCYEEDYSCIIRRVAIYKNYPVDDPWVNYLIENPPKTPAILDKILQQILAH